MRRGEPVSYTHLEDKVIKAVGVPEGQKVSAMVALGYADEEPAMPKRKSVGELLILRK